MERPEQHETDSAADAQFRAVFFEWAITRSERDYGWDYMVELFKEHKSTGLMFAGQLKGSRHTKYSSDGTLISQPLEQDAATYLAQELEQPTFLFHADVISKKLFWSAIQLDPMVLASLEKGETESLTVRIPTANLLPDGMDRFLTEFAQAKMAVISRVLLGTRSVDFVDSTTRQPEAKGDGRLQTTLTLEDTIGELLPMLGVSKITEATLRDQQFLANLEIRIGLYTSRIITTSFLIDTLKAMAKGQH